MIVDSVVLTDSVIGTARARPENGDNEPTIPNTILIVSQAQLKNIIGIPTGVINPDVSVIASFSATQPASTAIVVATLVSIPPGKYTIDAFLSARFVLSPPAGFGTDVRIDLINAPLTTGVTLVGVYGRDLEVLTAQRRLSVILTEPCLIRRIVTATGVGQSIDYTTSVSIERQI